MSFTVPGGRLPLLTTCQAGCQKQGAAGFSGRPLLGFPTQSYRSFCTLSRDTRPLQLVAALSQSSGETYQGVYGPWTVEESDRKEVLGYRAGLTAAAAALLIDTLISWLPVGNDNGLQQILRPLSDIIAVAGAGGFGASLVLIHIYIKPMKRLLQALYAVGLAGGLYLMATQSQSLPEYVASHREAVWAVGPLFAAVTGVAFKEGVCYGKPECAALFFTVPALLLGHLGGFLPSGVEQGLLAAFVALAGVFAARKYTQPIKDDIGDKSIFECALLHTVNDVQSNATICLHTFFPLFKFLKLSEDEQQAKVAQMNATGSNASGSGLDD